MPPQEKVPDSSQSQEQENDPPCLELAQSSYTNEAFVNDHGAGNDKEAEAKTQEKSLEATGRDEKKSCEDEKDSFEFDDLLPHIGEFGMYQRILFLMMIPFAFFVAWVYFTQIFITILPDQHWCWVPELANLTVEERLALAVPKTIDGMDRCRMYAPEWSEVLKHGVKEADPSWPIVSCKNGWEYNLTDVPYASIAAEQNWVCEDSALPHTAQSIFFCGAILGGLVFGWIADRMGRIPALVGSNLVGFIGGIATGVCNSFWTFCFCRFLVGMAFDNAFTMMYILVLEYVGPKWRTFVANMSIAIFFTFAATILPWIAFYLADWRMLCYATSAPLALAILTPWFVPESARWLVSQGKFDKAIEILRKFEKINGSHVKEEIYTQFRTSCARAQKEEEMDKSYTVLDLFKTPRLRKITIVMILMWMAVSLVFDGHVRNVGTLGLNVFFTFTIASFTEFPADTFLTLVLDRWGRRWLACGSMILSGVFSLLATTVPLGVPSASLAIIGRFAVNISYNIGLQYAAELLPTVVRAQGVALVHIMGYVASILAPFVVYLANVSVSLPLFILGILGILGGLLALLLPETLDQELPQTLQDGENFGIDQKFMDMPCINKKCNSVDRLSEFRRSTRSSVRASVRGEVRSSMIHRASSIRSRKSICLPEHLQA